MKFLIEIECDNAAFEDAPEDEVGRILITTGKHLRERVTAEELPEFNMKLRDINGNTVGIAKVVA